MFFFCPKWEVGKKRKNAKGDCHDLAQMSFAVRPLRGRVVPARKPQVSLVSSFNFRLVRFFYVSVDRKRSYKPNNVQVWPARVYSHDELSSWTCVKAAPSLLCHRQKCQFCFTWSICFVSNILLFLWRPRLDASHLSLYLTDELFMWHGWVIRSWYPSLRLLWCEVRSHGCLWVLNFDWGINVIK